MIHYHGNPISGTVEAQMAFACRHAMISFARPDNVEVVAEVCQSFAIDNGAFSIWKNGKGRINLKEYAQFVDTWMRHPAFDWYIHPDVIDGGEQANLDIRREWYRLVGETMFSRGVTVWHMDESLGRLGDLIATNVGNQPLAIGSAGQFADVGSTHWWNRISEAMSLLCDSEGRPRVRLHGLRMLDPDVFSHVPLSSADSTNVARHAGSDERWRGAYVPSSKRMRAMVIMDRIEHHAAANRWEGHRGFRNWSLFG